MIGEPTITVREHRHTIGIRTITPFRGMFAVRDALLTELRRWVQQQGIPDAGPYFLRYHVIDMNHLMAIEVGAVVAQPCADDGRVTSGVLPAGTYAHLTYTRYARRANSTLLRWAQANGLHLDHWADPVGDAFGCRYEAYLTDARLEPRKSRWQVELAIKLADS